MGNIRINVNIEEVYEELENFDLIKELFNRVLTKSEAEKILKGLREQHLLGSKREQLINILGLPDLSTSKDISDYIVNNGFSIDRIKN